jgi:hypothetical protein
MQALDTRSRTRTGLNSGAFATAQAVAAAALFIICSLLVAFLPDATVRFTQYAFHTNLSAAMSPVGVGGFCVGLLLVSVGWGLFAWLVASVYNRLASGAAEDEIDRTYQRAVQGRQ